MSLPPIDESALLLVAVLGFVVCLWNVASAYADWRAVNGDKAKVISKIATGALIRTALCLVCQLILLGSIFIEADSAEPNSWRAVVEVRSAMVAIIVALMSVHERAARIMVQHAAEEELNEEG